MTTTPHRRWLGTKLFEFVPDPIFLLDPEGTFLDLNPAAARYLGRSVDEIVGHSVREVFPPEHVERQLEVIHHVVETGEEFVEERPTSIGDEDYVFQYAVRRLENHEGEPVGVFGMVRDVTSLVALERRYAELYEKATDALFAVDLSGRMRALNRQAETISGYSRRELENLHFTDLVAPEELGRLKGYFERRLRGEEAPTEYEVRYIHASGEERWVEVHISREASSVGTFQASVRDVTERKRLEAVRQEFLQMVSHDVKTPLAVIQGFASALASGLYGRTTAEQADSLERILGASRRVRRLMDQFLLAESLDGEDQRVREPGPLRQCVDWAVGAVAGEAEARGLSLSVDFDEVAQVAVPDAEGLRRVLENLLSNAVKFTGGRGRVHLHGAPEGEGVRVQVEDTGVGIPEGELARVFERFFRASNSGGTGGSGLGLYIVRRLVEQMGGTVSAASRVGEGTRFRVWVPTEPLG